MFSYVFNSARNPFYNLSISYYRLLVFIILCRVFLFRKKRSMPLFRFRLTIGDLVTKSRPAQGIYTP